MKDRYFLSALMLNSFIWVRSGVEKILSGNFPQSLSGVLTKFASQNPYSWFKDILTNFSIPNALIIGYIVQYAETIAGIMLFLGSILLMRERTRLRIILLLVGCIISLGLNLSFYLASGWTGVSTETLNLLMIGLEGIGVIYCVNQLKK